MDSHRWPLSSFDTSFEHGLGQCSVSSMLAELGQGIVMQNDAVIELVNRASKVLDELPTLVTLDIPVGGKLHVVGDIHGQYDEFIQVLEICGPPVPEKNVIIFNGDFVDRGRQSTEVMIGLLALVLAYPNGVYLNRGNHESRSMNRRYGFEEEVYSKCSREAFDAFSQLFCLLPLATLVNGSVFVTHGGLPSVDGITLRDIAAVDRRQEPRGGLLQDLLWSDPSPHDGRHRSPRGGGLSCFGPDVTRRFCDDNRLLCCIRSHEVCEHGFEWQRGDRCLTVFSAANYVGYAGNLGAVVHISPGKAGSVEVNDLKMTTFKARAGAPAPRRSRL